MDEVRVGNLGYLWKRLLAGAAVVVVVAGVIGGALGGWQWSVGGAVGSAAAVLDLLLLLACAVYWFAAARGRRVRLKLVLILLGKTAVLPLVGYGLISWGKLPVYPLVAGLAFGATLWAGLVVGFLWGLYRKEEYVS